MTIILNILRTFGLMVWDIFWRHDQFYPRRSYYNSDVDGLSPLLRRQNDANLVFVHFNDVHGSRLYFSTGRLDTTCQCFSSNKYANATYSVGL